MSIALRGAVQTGQDAYPITLSKPAGVVVGDVLFALQVCNLSITPDVVPGTWTTISLGSNAFVEWRVSCRVVDGTEASSFDFTNNSGFRTFQTAVLWAESGVDNTTPYEAFANGDDTNDATIIASDITSTVDASLRVIFNVAGDGSEPVVNAPAGASELSEQTRTGSWTTALFVNSAPTAGAQGTASTVWTSRTFGGLWGQFIIRPTPSGPQTFNVSITEAITLAETIAGNQKFSVALTESITLADSSTGTLPVRVKKFLVALMAYFNGPPGVGGGGGGSGVTFDDNAVTFDDLPEDFV